MSTPAGWPGGRNLAVSVSVMLEGWSDGAAPDGGSRRRWSAESAPEVRQSDLARMLSVAASRGTEP